MSASVRLRLAKRRRLRGCDVTRTQTVALDVVLAVLGADIACQHLQSALRSSIGTHGLATEFGHHRADIDDLAFAPCHHLRQYRSGYNVWCYQVNIDHLLEFLTLHLMHRYTLDDAGVINENIDLSYLLMNTLHKSLDGVLVRHVAYIAVRVVNALCMIRF